ncbi:MAG: hypothetical protein JXQ65_03170 [Candidatus Marinimicrobia bacterium]|nr:hypothetical protein [Candidatus Neomarinimicrobiota bacterium]
MKKMIYLAFILFLLAASVFANTPAVKINQEVPTILIDTDKENFDIRVMYAFVKLYQINEKFDLGQVVIKINDENAEELKVLVRKCDLEKLANREIDYKTFIRDYAKFI